MVGWAQGTSYEAPLITDYGDLARLTAVVYPAPFAEASQDLSFSSPAQAPGPDALAVAPAAADSPGTTAEPAADSAPEGAGAVGGVGTSNAGGGGSSSLPFTGFVPGVVAVIGSGLTAIGYTIRRLLR